MNSKNLGFGGNGRNPANQRARVVDLLQDWR
jgi:hypothetical protein